MPGFHINEMGEIVLDAIEDIGVVDVYDLASQIGKECEKIIDHYGPDSVTGLMPRVINSLELLEALATKNENGNTTIQELNDRIAQLESEKLEKAEFRKRFEKVFHIQNILQKTRIGGELDKKLQNGEKLSNGDCVQLNRILVDDLVLDCGYYPSTQQKIVLAQSIVHSYSQLGCDLPDVPKHEIELIEEQWRTETRELVDLVSSLQDENKRIIKQQQDLQSSSAHSSGLGNSLTDSIINYDISSSLSDTQVLQRLKEQIHKQRDELKTKDNELQEKLVDIENLNIQIERLTNTGRESRRRQKLLQVQVRTLCEERADFLAQLQDQHREITILRKRLGIAEKENEDLTKSNDDDNDPNRPRYTTSELKELLSERDELLTKINDLSEQLSAFKPDEDLNKPEENEERCETPPEEDPPVQGPLPYEPDDAPWKKTNESGIRKFFRKLFSEPDANSFPRRSLSTLSKMALSAGPNHNSTI